MTDQVLPPPKSGPHQGPGPRTDCSQWLRAVYLKAGADDPGAATGAMVGKAKPISADKLKPGDIVIYGSGGGHHVELYIGNGNTIGHGDEKVDMNHGINSQPEARPMTYDFLDN